MTCRRWKIILVVCLGLMMGGQANSAVSPRGVAINDALIGVLIEAIVHQLDGRPVEMKLGVVELQANDLSGTGQLRIQGDGEWIGFRFRLPQDYQIIGAGDVRIDIGGVTADEHDLPNDPHLVSLLEGEILGALSKGPGHSIVRLQLDRIETQGAGASYRRIDTTGIADFGLDGSRAIRIQGLYDQHKNAWLYTRYWLEKTDQ